MAIASRRPSLLCNQTEAVIFCAPGEVVDESRHALVPLPQPQCLRVSVSMLLSPQVRHRGTLGYVFQLQIRNEAIALEIAAGVVAVERPVLHADPAELFAALAAAHVVAALVLLDRRLTARALLGVRRHPQSYETTTTVGQ